ncbi:MAG: PD-(D/E)XK nuclease family protein, partial [Wohlfahrtiimonas sp.]
MTKPNLFNFATSELSQDAFICWILDHANPNYTDVDPELKSIAFLMINRFLELNNQPTFNAPSDITYLEPKCQYKNIDVLLIVNKYAIIIEDKTVAKVHGKQLQKYTEVIQHTDNEYKNHTHGYIFFKTHDQSNYKKVSEDGFKLFLRKDILEIFNQYPNINNDIYQDFYARLNKLEIDVTTYQTIAMSKWQDHQWIGFFKDIQSRFDAINIP